MWEARTVSIYRLLVDEPLTQPALITALDGWVDAGSAGTAAAEHIAKGGEVVATFDADALLDYRARRPTLDIALGRMAEMAWLQLSVTLVRAGARDLLVLTGPEPDYRWQEFKGGVVELARRLAVVDSVCMGAIPAMVPHTRATPVLMTGTERRPGPTDPPLPAEFLRVPGSAVNLVEMGCAEQGIRSVGCWAHVPHYVGGTYPAGALALVERVAEHLGVAVPVDELAEQSRRERIRLDQAVAGNGEAQEYVRRLEETSTLATMAAGEGVNAGEGLAAEVERFLRERTGDDRDPSEGQ